MVVAVNRVAKRFYNVVANVPFAVDVPALAVGDIEVWYGRAPFKAVQGLDYTVKLEEDFMTFSVTPTVSLEAKIASIMAADSQEVSYITVRREMEIKTEATPGNTRNTTFLTQEFDRHVMVDQQLSDRMRRAVTLAPNVEGESAPLLKNLLPGTYLRVSEDGKFLESGGSDFSREDIDAIAADASTARLAALEARQWYEATLESGGFAMPRIDALVASTDVLPVGTIVALKAEGVAMEVAPDDTLPLMRRLGTGRLDPVYTGYTMVTAGGVKLRPAPGSPRITPRMCGAVADGVTNDREAIIASFIYSGWYGVPCAMEGRAYASNEAINTVSNLRVQGGGAVIYFTAWPITGGFFGNVWGGLDRENAAAERVQTNIRIEDLITDAGRLVPEEGKNSNLMGFARGASNAYFIRCKARNMARGTGGGTGGGAFGDELGAEAINYVDCVAENCFRGFRSQSEDGVFDDGGGARKTLRRIRVHNFTAINCGCAILGLTPLAAQSGVLQSPDFDIADTVFTGITTAVNCGHYPWSPVDYSTSSVQPQKAGVIVLGGAMNMHIAHLRVRNDMDLTTRENWYGTGYPPAGSNFIGAGLSGPVGAVVWGHGLNVTIDRIDVDGSFDYIYKLARAVTFGEGASLPPAYSTDPVNSPASLCRVKIGEVRHVRGSVHGVFDAMQTPGGVAPLNENVAVRMGPVTINSFSALDSRPGQVIGPNGTANLSGVFIEMRGNTGRSMHASIDYYRNNPVLTFPADFNVGSFSAGGGSSGNGGRAGLSYTNGSLRLSAPSTTAWTVETFYSGDGTGANTIAGSIVVTGGTTAFVTSSDQRLKQDPQPFDASAILRVCQFHNYERISSGSREYGVFAQELMAVFPEAVFYDEEEDTYLVDYSKLVPVLGRAWQELDDRVAALEARG